MISGGNETPNNFSSNTSKSSSRSPSPISHSKKIVLYFPPNFQRQKFFQLLYKFQTTYMNSFIKISMFFSCLFTLLFISSIHFHRFCSSEDDIICRQCPEHANCNGTFYFSCTQNLIPVGQYCLSTNLNYTSLNELHMMIKKINNFDSALSFIKKIPLYSNITRDDMYAIIYFHDDLKVNKNGLISSNIFLPNEAIITTLLIFWFMILLILLYFKISFIHRKSN